jgi:formylglycine-generating enzyme
MRKPLSFILLSLLGSFELYAQSSGSFPVKPELVFVKEGTFAMGSNSGVEDEQPVHSVMVSDFSIGKYEVTVAQFRAFCEAVGRPMPKAPEWGWEDQLPIVNVNYLDALAYCRWLSDTFGGNWRLPTEAEWEYAARGGNQSRDYTYAGGNDMDELGWFMYNSWDQPNPVGTKKPNELGIYDMSGNVSEWCADWYGSYSSNPATNPKGPSSGEDKVLRGGSWFYYEDVSRIVSRSYHPPSKSLDTLGFRVVLSQ